MNFEYLNSLPALENKYDFDLDEGEKVVYSVEIQNFGDENSMALCSFDYAPKVSVTNQKIWVRTGERIFWTIDLKEEVAEIKKVNSRVLLLFKVTYFEIGLLQKAEYTAANNTTRQVAAYQLYLNKKDEKAFEEFINKMME